MKIINGSICSPHGFLATGVYAGIRKNPDKPDLAIIYSKTPAVAAGVFTTNLVKAAPLLLTQQHLQTGTLQAIVVNSGNANACTGEIGKQHALQMATTAATQLAIREDKIAVASTGVIGTLLPIEKIHHGIERAVAKLGEDDDTAARAIMTTDTFPKKIAIEIQIGNVPVRIGAIAKGSGMIHPNMATMLCFVTTDAAITQAALQQALDSINQKTFNMITVDGDSSTNDMVLVLANGTAKNPEIKNIDSPEGKQFSDALAFVCTHLAKQIAKDGEGATKLIEVQVQGAATEAEAQISARAICRSPLVKTAVFGEDANWGRIASALGASGIVFDPNKVCIHLGELTLFQNGTPVVFDENKARTLLKQDTVIIKVNLQMGNANAYAWGCDLTYEYITINSSYRS